MRQNEGKDLTKVLEVNVDDNGFGGVYSLVRSVILSRPEGFRFDIACIMPFENQAHVEELKEAGCRVFFVGREGSSHVTMREEENNLYALLEKEQYDCVHIHGDTAFRLLPFGKAAARAGVPRIIYHSHATEVDGRYRSIKRFLHRMLRGRLKKTGTVFAACSDLAAAWMYPWLPADRVVRISNGIDLNKFRFDPAVRAEEREALGAGDRYVIGHVGRFAYQKNHGYLIDIFAQLKREMPDAVLLLVGSGSGHMDIYDGIVRKVQELHLENDVIFYGTSPHVERLMQAMDVFVLPSHFEGLPVVGVEAQAAGLPVLYSSEITREAQLTENVAYAGIKPGDIGTWVALLKKMRGVRRQDTYEILKRQNYDIEDTIRSFLALYR